jgi:hypothetical protein
MDLPVELVPAMKEVLQRVRVAHERATSLAVADAFLDLLDALGLREREAHQTKKPLCVIPPRPRSRTASLPAELGG